MRLLVVADRRPEAAEQDALGDEDDAEADDEQHRAGDQAPVEPGPPRGQRPRLPPLTRTPSRLSRIARPGQARRRRRGSPARAAARRARGSRARRRAPPRRRRRQRPVLHGVGERRGERHGAGYCSAMSEVRTGCRSPGVHLLEVDGGDALLLVDHHGERQPVRRHVAELERGLARLVPQHRVADLVVGDERGAGVLARPLWCRRRRCRPPASGPRGRARRAAASRSCTARTSSPRS